MGSAAVSVQPLGTSSDVRAGGNDADGLPVGLQLIGPWFGEQRLLDVAGLLEKLLGWQDRPPEI